MHELPIVKSVLEAALRHAAGRKAEKIHSIVLVVGQMHDIVVELVDKFFRFAAKGTIAQGAVVEIELIPVICRCRACKENYVLHLHGSEEKMCCPVCGSVEADRLSGDEFMIREIKIT
jgi:hydrogenase nickel incorporation protein HypA/HybF